jgi:hypothetical protein
VGDLWEGAIGALVVKWAHICLHVPMWLYMYMAFEWPQNME